MLLTLLPLLAFAGDAPTQGSPEAPSSRFLPTGAGGGGGTAEGLGGLPRSEPPASPLVIMTIGEPFGGQAPPALDGALRSASPRVQYCYEKEAAKDPTFRAAGTVAVRLVVDPTGLVTSATIASSTLAAPAVEACIERNARALELPASSRTVTVSYPFTFTVSPEPTTPGR